MTSTRSSRKCETSLGCLQRRYHDARSPEVNQALHQCQPTSRSRHGSEKVCLYCPSPCHPRLSPRARRQCTLDQIACSNFASINSVHSQLQSHKNMQLLMAKFKTPAVNSFHGGWVAARDAALPLRGSTLGEPRPTRVGSSGGTCAAHSDARARAHARARPRCTLQHTISLHCTCSTHAHFGTCALTCTPRRGASGRGGRHWARHGRATSQERHRGPSRGPQPPQHDAARRFAAALQLVDKDAAGRESSGRAARHGSIMP